MAHDGSWRRVEQQHLLIHVVLELHNIAHCGFEIIGEPYLSKPATPDQLVAAMERLIQG